jgi:hypothetical protein
MKSNNVRTSLDLPRDLHRRLRAEAAKRSCSARSLILAAIEQTVASPAVRKGRLKLVRPVVASPRKPFSLTNEEIYELGFP